MTEEWRTINEYPNYEVSSLGNVRSVARKRRHWKGGESFFKSKLLRQIKDKGGYLSVFLYQDGVPKRFTVHRLVAKAFIPENGNGRDVNHLNHNKSDNRAANLEWSNDRENVTHQYKKIKKSSSYTGVCFDKSKSNWVAYIDLNGKRKYLGRFNDEASAATAYQSALKQYNLNNKYAIAI